MTGTLNLVSVGPGFSSHITTSAREALEASDVIVGYDLYFRWIKEWIAEKEVFTSPLTQERLRASKALDLARQGRNVALISSGDVGVYAMAALVFEEMREDDCFSVRTIPGVTAATACASLLGSPLSHDFATLSLSDLLCPWDWIEHRATKMAEADLAVVLYNVQSAGRRAGVYKILDIMLAHKPATTWCGIVRNAYREDQSTRICTLSELRETQFDMLTTVVIGNRQTRRVGNWIFTPRGYNRENLVPCQSNLPDENHLRLPSGAVWIFSGTGDGNRLAEAIRQSGEKVIISASSQYGKETAEAACPGADIIWGRIGRHRRADLLDRLEARCIVDATHPYALEMSVQLISLSEELALPYVRFERDDNCLSDFSDDVHACETPEEAGAAAVRLGKRIFLATGAKELERFLAVEHSKERQWFVRVIPDAEMVRRAVSCGIARDRVCAMEGPFSRQFNEALWRQWQIDCVVTRASGTAGGFEEKMASARSMGIPLVVIRRPKLSYPRVESSFDRILRYINEAHHES